MQRSLYSIILGFGLVASGSAVAGEWKAFPVRDADYKPEMTLSLVGGNMNPSHVANGSYVGAELAFNCIAIQPPTGIIRSKVSLGSFDKNGMKITTFEVNPRWTTHLSDNLTFGIGPGIGYVKTDMAGQTTNMAALQAGVELDYRIGALNLGLGARWQGTQNKLVTNTLRGADNALIQAKLGINF